MATRYEHWRKSSHSAPNGECIEVSPSTEGTIGVRDSKNADTSPVLDFAPREWAAFLRTLRSRQDNQ